MMQILKSRGVWFSLFMVMLSTFLLSGAECYGAAKKKSKSTPPPIKVETITATEVKVLADIGANPVLVDTQAEEAFKNMRIVGAVNVPWKKVIVEPVDLPRNRPLIVYCDCPDDSSSTDVARQLIRDWGYTEVKVLKAGLNGWICHGYPIEGATAGRNLCK